MNLANSEFKPHNYRQWGHRFLKIAGINLLAAIALNWAWKSVAHDAFGLTILRFSDFFAVMIGWTALIIVSAICWRMVSEKPPA